jgi:hypothetical protein
MISRDTPIYVVLGAVSLNKAISSNSFFEGLARCIFGDSALRGFGQVENLVLVGYLGWCGFGQFGFAVLLAFWGEGGEAGFEKG